MVDVSHHHVRTMESAKPQMMEIYHAHAQLDGPEHDVKLISILASSFLVETTESVTRS